VLFVATNLMLLGFTEKEAWEMPVGKAFWYSGAYIENGSGNPLNWRTGYDTQLEEEIKRRISEGKIVSTNTTNPTTK